VKAKVISFEAFKLFDSKISGIKINIEKLKKSEILTNKLKARPNDIISIIK
jgi:hypothetical protein